LSEIKIKVISICSLIINDEVDIVSGCRELAMLRHQGHEFIPIIFVGYDSELDYIPLPSEYHLWNKEALKNKLQEMDNYKEAVLNSAKDLLQEMTK
jgi:hypothetical protein